MMLEHADDHFCRTVVVPDAVVEREVEELEVGGFADFLVHDSVDVGGGRAGVVGEDFESDLLLDHEVICAFVEHGVVDAHSDEEVEGFELGEVGGGEVGSGGGGETSGFLEFALLSAAVYQNRRANYV